MPKDWSTLYSLGGDAMTLSQKAKKSLQTGIGVAAGTEVAAAINTGTTQAANVPALAATDDLVGVDGVGSNAAPLVETEERLDDLETKVNAILTSLKAAGLMASS